MQTRSRIHESGVECTNYEEKGGTVSDFFVALQMHSAKRVCLFWRGSVPSPEGLGGVPSGTLTETCYVLGLGQFQQVSDN